METASEGMSNSLFLDAQGNFIHYPWGTLPAICRNSRWRNPPSFQKPETPFFPKPRNPLLSNFYMHSPEKNMKIGKFFWVFSFWLPHLSLLLQSLCNLAVVWPIVSPDFWPLSQIFHSGHLLWSDSDFRVQLEFIRVLWWVVDASRWGLTTWQPLPTTARSAAACI